VNYVNKYLFNKVHTIKFNLYISFNYTIVDRMLSVSLCPTKIAARDRNLVAYHDFNDDYFIDSTMLDYFACILNCSIDQDYFARSMSGTVPHSIVLRWAEHPICFAPRNFQVHETDATYSTAFAKLLFARLARPSDDSP